MGDLPVASIVCAFGAALLFAIAAVAQQTAAANVREDQSLVRELARSPRWWAGLIGDGGGYVLQAVALALGSVLVVQPILVTALVFALPLSARFAHRTVGARNWALAAALCVALAVFLVIGNPTEGDGGAPFSDWALPLAVLLAVVAVATAYGVLGSRRVDPGRRALLLGTAGGLLFGLAAALTQYVTRLLEHGPAHLLTSWQTWALVASGAVGLYLQQRAYQVGPLTASLPAVTVGEPIAAAYIGMTVLDERLRAVGGGLLVTIAAVVVMCVTAVALSRSEAVG